MKQCLLPVILLLALANCGPASLQKVAAGLNDLAKVTAVAQNTIIQANETKLLDDETTRTILGTFVRVNEAQKSAVAVLRQLAKLDNPTRTQLLEIVNPIAAEVGKLVDQGTVGIKDEALKQRIRAVILTIQSSVHVLHLMLASGG